MVEGSAGIRIAALLTSFNRCELTIACIDRLVRQAPSRGGLDIYLLDAGSTDGTADAVESRFDDVFVMRGHQQQFWSSGMHAAWSAALRRDYDFYLWVNDDTLLDDDAVARVLDTYRGLVRDHGADVVVVGSTRDPITGDVTYGGRAVPDPKAPLRFEIVQPARTTPRPAVTMNGNLVLVPREVVNRIGTVDKVFFHGLGDFDYGLRATAAGCEVWVAPGTIGTCAKNQRMEGGRWARLRQIFGPTRTRFVPWLTFVRRWGGRRWPIAVVALYYRHARKALSLDAS